MNARFSPLSILPFLKSSIRPLNWAPLPSHNMKQKATNWAPEEYKTDERHSILKANMRSAYFKPKVSSKPTKAPLKVEGVTNAARVDQHQVMEVEFEAHEALPTYADPFSREDGDEAYVVLQLKLEGCDSLRRSVG